MQTSQLITRASGKVRRILAERFERRLVRMRTTRPIVSFTFDDAPRTAFVKGGDILQRSGARGTYYLSLGLLDTETEVGRIAGVEDLQAAVADGHELGCHTFDHFDAWHTPAPAFMASVVRNAEMLDQLLPETKFSTFAYPKSGAKLSVKQTLGKQFDCCRGGGQTTNEETIDLNLLKACFIDRRTGVDLEFIGKLLDYNAARCGWLIIATHDVADDPSPYGCAPQFLESVVRLAARSDAMLLPVGEACAIVSESAHQAASP